MGGIGGPEVLVILVVALLVFGPKSLPGVARGVGKGMRELRKLATEFQREMNLADALDEQDRRLAGGRRPGPPPAGPVDVGRPSSGESTGAPGAEGPAAAPKSPPESAGEAPTAGGPPAPPAKPGAPEEPGDGRA